MDAPGKAPSVMGVPMKHVSLITVRADGQILWQKGQMLILASLHFKIPPLYWSVPTLTYVLHYSKRRIAG